MKSPNGVQNTLAKPICYNRSMEVTLPIEQVKGVGPKTAAILHKAGIFTLRDLFYYLPRDYENYQTAVSISKIRPGKVIIKGKISDLKTRRAKSRNLAITEGIIRDNTDAVRVVWFNQPYRAKQFAEGKEYYFTGLYDLKNGRYQLTAPSAVLAQDIDKTDAFQPIYPAKGSLKSQNFKKFIGSLRSNFSAIPDILPHSENCPDFIKKSSRADALFKVHFPENATDVEQGRNYLAYEELFELLLAAKLNKQENQKLKAISLPFVAEKTQKLVQNLPFQLTNAQRRATWDILQDLEKSTPMNRLLQGDVGAGKTVVAAISAAQAAQNGHQTALLAPTAILATQHAETLRKLLKPFNVEIALLTGATKHKTELKKQIKEGKVDLIVGTHALLTDDTEFKSLAFCIIDEQHRFGVAERQKLLAKTTNTDISPHLLSMTATPIPRSLQLTIFGDLDISVLNELPKGRKPIKTKILPEINLKESLYPGVKEAIAQKEQVYWICKAIDDNPTSETISVKKQAEKLAKIFPKAKISYLHGRMRPAEKDEIMDDFAAGKIDILVSTTVVEVGVDVPNATIMVIMDADQYGLAQLHQLRGRVGRGQKDSFCYLVIPGENEPTRRLRELEKSTDGFYLAEVDLSMRGPGEIYGNLQHGALDLRIATLSNTKMVAEASRHAYAFAKNPENMVKYPELMKNIKKYQQLTTLN